MAAFQNQPEMWLSTASVKRRSFDALQEHLARHLPLAEARHLDALGEILGCVLDGVVDVVRRHLDRELDLVLRELFDRLGHRQAIRPDRYLQPTWT